MPLRTFTKSDFRWQSRVRYIDDAQSFAVSGKIGIVSTNRYAHHIIVVVKKPVSLKFAGLLMLNIRNPPFLSAR